MKATARSWVTVLILLVDDVVLVLLVIFILWKIGVRLPLGAVVALAIVAGIAIFLLQKVVLSVLTKKETGGPSGLVGREGKVITPLSPEGVIKIHGELWNALSTQGNAKAGEQVTVVGLEGLTLMVEPKTADRDEKA